MNRIALIGRALAWLHRVDGDQGILDAIAAAENVGNVDWTALLAAIGHAVYAASGSPSTASIIAIFMQFAHPAPPQTPEAAPQK